MPVPPLDDRALEALLSGARSSQSGFDWLVPFVEELGEASSGPAPAMKPALAMLVAHGLSTEKGDLPATAASNVTGPAPQAAGLPKWRKKMLTSELLAGLVTKLAGLGMAAKAGMGLTLAAASTTAAGAVGVLPEPAQHAVATVVAAATPFTFPDKAHDNAGLGATVSVDATGASDATPGVDGQAVSDAAKTGHGGEDSTIADDAGDGNDADGDRGGAKATGVGPSSGTTGLDRANQTPAAGHVPTSVPGPQSSSTGLDRAEETPAADRVPSSAPPAGPRGPGPQGSVGLDTAGDTPAAGRAPAGRPGRR